MKTTTTLICVILGVWVCGVYCNEDNSVEFPPAETQSSDLASVHHRVRRSPLDPIVAPLLIGKSFLYGALVGPKLFKPYVVPRYYYHHHLPVHHYPKFPGYGYGGYGAYGAYGGYGGGYGYGR